MRGTPASQRCKDLGQLSCQWVCWGTYGCHDWAEGDPFLVYLRQAIDLWSGGELMGKC